MIDWLAFSVPWDGPRISEQYFRQDNETGELVPAYTKAMNLEGSWSSKLWAHTKEGRLYLSCNPAKFLSGQNVVGSEDVHRLVAVLVGRVYRAVGACDLFHGAALAAVEAGEVKLTRVDCTYHYPVGHDDDVATWLAAMEDACFVRYRGRGHFDPGMCAIRFGVSAGDDGRQKASRRSTFKFYNKWRELRKHPLQCRHEVLEQLESIAYGVVRGEACYRGLELAKLGKAKLSDWNSETCWNLHAEWIGKMQISGNVELLDRQELDLPRGLRRTYRDWRDGRDMRALLSRSQFYANRRALMEHGIDIALPRSEAKVERRRVLPVLEVLSAGPARRAEHEDLFWRLAA